MMFRFNPAVIVLCAALALLTGLVDTSRAAVNQAEPASSVQEDLVLQAMTDELRRSMKELRLEKKTRPYFIKVTCTDIDSIKFQYELGKRVDYDEHSDRIADVEVHVGDHKFDNTANLTTRTGGTTSRYVALEDNYDQIRRNLWILIDDAYKSACEDLEKQEAYRRGHIIRNLCDSFSLSTPNTSIDPISPPLKLDKSWETRIQSLSSVFSKFPEIRKSWVVLEMDRQIFRCTTSEGTILRDEWSPLVIGVTAYARCDDGEDIWDCDFIRVTSSKHVPEQEQLEASARRLAENLVAYTKAERKNYYFGPVLFQPQAASELLQHGIAPKLCANPGDNLQPSGTLLRCINTRILPKFLSIADDPVSTEIRGHRTLGTAAFDDEGIACKKVQLVEKGFLKELLCSRTPVLPRQTSNGRFRSGQVLPTTLVMQVHQPTNTKTLEGKLIQLAKEQGLKEALIVTRIEKQTPRVLNGDGISGRSDSLQRYPPLEVYSVNVETGKRTRVRGLLFRDFGLPGMQGIVAAGNDAVPFNSVNWAGYIRSVVAPSLLVNHMELEEDAKNTLTPYPVLNPNFAAN